MASPSLTGLDAPTFAENIVNAVPQLIDSDVTFTDADDDFNGGTLTVSGLLAQDRVSVQSSGLISFNSGNGEISYNGVVIGVASGGVGASFSVTFNASAASAAIEALIEHLTYANISDTPTATRDLSIVITDAAGNGSGGGAAGPSYAPGGVGPFAGLDGGHSHVDFADIDGDGDADLLLSTDATVTVFEDTAAPGAPSYTNRGLIHTDPLPVFAVFADLDGDGDEDVIVASVLTGTMSFYRNEGGFVLQTGPDDPFGAFGIAWPRADFGDLDGDGDLDMLVGSLFGELSYFANIGTATDPVFSRQLGATNPFDGIALGGYAAAPTLIDLDGDGDLDAVFGAYEGPARYFENTGTADSAVMVERTGADSPFDGLTFNGNSRLAFADIDQDGDLDFATGSYLFPQDVRYWVNTGAGGDSLFTIGVTPQAEPVAVNGVRTGGAAGDAFQGGGGDDALAGGAGDDLLLGGGGADSLNGGAGADFMAGGLGDDVYTTDGLDTLQEQASHGTDTVRTSVSFTLGAYFENLTLTGSGDANGTGNGEINVITGNIGSNQLRGEGGNDTLNGQAGADSLWGGDGADVLNGGNDNDTLYGEGGADSLNGGSGADWLDGGAGGDAMAGGTGDDVYVVDDTGDVVTEMAGQGTETVRMDLSRYTLTANVENLTGTSAGKQTLTGNDLRNVVVAGAGNDILDGKGDNDHLTGAGGDDRMTGGLGADVFVILDSDMVRSTLGGGQQVDVVMDFTVSQGDRIDLSAIDANANTLGDDAFTFVSTFTRTAGEGRLAYNAATNTTTLQLDVDGDGVADYQLNLKGGDFTHSPIMLGGDPVNHGGWVI